MRYGLVSEKQVTAVRAAQWGCPVFSVPKHAIHSGIQILSTVIQLYSAIALHHRSATKRLLLGFVDVIEYWLLYAIEQMTGCKKQSCFVTPSNFRMQLHQGELALEQYANSTSKEVMFEGNHTAAEMALILSSATDLEADEVIIGRCREFIWSRMICGPKKVEFLFGAG